MKKGFILLLLASSIGAKAQTPITITGSDVAVVGTTMIMAYDTLVTTNPGPGGTNMTWNFNTLTAGYTDTIAFQSPVGTQYASMFPNSNVYLTYPGYPGGAYLIKNTNELSVDGFGDPSTAVDLDPNERLLTLNTTYNTSFSNTSRTEYRDSTTMFPPADSFKYTSMKMKTSLADAWGTLVLPSGTFNVIRVKDVEYTYDSFFIKLPVIGYQNVDATIDTNYHYSWWAKGQSYPILSVDSNSDGVGEYYYLKLNTNSVKDINALAAKMYPNPAKDVVHFTTASARASISIFDVKGSLVRKVDNLNGEFSLQVADLNNGMYTYIITGDDEKTTKGTFQVMH